MTAFDQFATVAARHDRERVSPARLRPRLASDHWTNNTDDPLRMSLQGIAKLIRCPDCTAAVGDTCHALNDDRRGVLAHRARIHQARRQAIAAHTLAVEWRARCEH